MSTAYTPRMHLHRPHLNVWLVAVVALAAALIGLGAWVVVDRSTGGGGATQNATTVLDRFQAAFNAGDAAALAVVMAPNVEMRSLGDTASGRDVLANGIAAHVKQVGVRVDRVSPVTVNGEYAAFFSRYTEPGATGTFLSVFQLRNGKILRIWGYQPGVTPPFDNAARP